MMAVYNIQVRSISIIIYNNIDNIKRKLFKNNIYVLYEHYFIHTFVRS